MADNSRVTSGQFVRKRGHLLMAVIATYTLHFPELPGPLSTYYSVTWVRGLLYECYIARSMVGNAVCCLYYTKGEMLRVL